MKRCLITGASGFVGANLARRLLQDGHEVHVMLRPEHRPWRLGEIASAVHAHRGDVTVQGQVQNSVRLIRPDWVFHLAAYGSYPCQNGLARMVQVNLTGTALLLDACAEVGIESFVHTGSSSEYGYKDHPASEQELLEPNSDYSITKAAATLYCQLVARKNAVNAVTARLYSVYGPYEQPTRLVPTLILRGLEGKLPPLVSPSTARDFVFVDDAVDALVTLAGKTVPPGSVYNICTGSQTTLAAIVASARELMGIAQEPVWSSMERRAWDTDTWVGSSAAIENDLGWRSKIDVRTGLQRSIDWFQSNSSWRHSA